ncbi:MAG: hypothetical protein PUB07_07215 [Clostridia bacterium]|nr:hypothetical protein [Clostridia bacterium]
MEIIWYHPDSILKLRMAAGTLAKGISCRLGFSDDFTNLPVRIFGLQHDQGQKNLFLVCDRIVKIVAIGGFTSTTVVKATGMCSFMISAVTAHFASFQTAAMGADSGRMIGTVFAAASTHWCMNQRHLMSF